MPKIHTFDSTGEAYDASQCDDEISDGDLLIVESEKVVGILVEAWPVAVGTLHGEFHAHEETWNWSAVPTTRDETVCHDYSESYGLALQELLRLSVSTA